MEVPRQINIWNCGVHAIRAMMAMKERPQVISDGVIEFALEEIIALRRRLRAEAMTETLGI